MTDPFAQLGLGPDADDAAIRSAYLELVRRYPPEQAPERFAIIRAAYQVLQSRDDRLRWRLFDAGLHYSIETFVEELACRTPRRRPSLTELLAAARAR
jgi:curved DNA-binding protein CbpA